MDRHGVSWLSDRVGSMRDNLPAAPMEPSLLALASTSFEGPSSDTTRALRSAALQVRLVAPRAVGPADVVIFRQGFEDITGISLVCVRTLHEPLPEEERLATTESLAAGLCIYAGMRTPAAHP